MQPRRAAAQSWVSSLLPSAPLCSPQQSRAPRSVWQWWNMKSSHKKIAAPGSTDVGKLTPAFVVASHYFYRNKRAEGVLWTSEKTHSLAAESCSLSPSSHLALEGNELTFPFHFGKLQTNYLFILLPSFSCQGRKIRTALLGFLDLATFITWSLVPNRSWMFCASVKAEQDGRCAGRGQSQSTHCTSHIWGFAFLNRHQKWEMAVGKGWKKRNKKKH